MNQDLIAEKKYRRKLIFPCLLIILTIPGIYVLLASMTNIFIENSLIASLGYLLLRYLIPLVALPFVINFIAKKKSRKRVGMLVGINIIIGLLRLIVKTKFQLNQEFHLLLAFIINVYGRINLEKTGKLFSMKS